MANDSSTGGYLAGSVALGLADNPLEDLLQGVVVGITGLAGEMVRPRWQETVPQQPEVGTDWCAIGVTSIEPTDYPAAVHDPGAENDPDGGVPQGTDTVEQWETVNVLASFYGPNAMRNAKALRMGLYVDQNRDEMVEQGIDLIDVGTITAAPSLVNQTWQRRQDLPIRLRAKNELVIPILNLLSAPTATTTN